jgi:flagellar hook-associated protein 2
VATDETNSVVKTLGAGSGIDIKGLAKALTDAERVPRESLIQEKIDKSTAKISGLGVVKAVLERFKTAFKQLDSGTDFRKFSTTNSNNSALKLSTSALAKTGSHSVEVKSLALGARQSSSGFSSVAAQINGGEPFALQITSREQQKITFSASSAAGTIVVAGINIAVASGDTAGAIAAKAKEALEASGSSFISSNSGRELVAKSDGSLTVTFELSEGDVAATAFTVSSIGSADLTSTFTTLRNGVQELNVGSAGSTPLGVVSAINSSSSTLGVTAQLIDDGSGGANPYKILLTGETGENNQFKMTTTGSIPEVQKVTFGTAQTTGTFTVEGINVSVSAGESPSVIAARVKSTLDANTFITNSAGRSIESSTDGTMLINYTRSDGDIAFPTFANLTNIVSVGIAEDQSFSANSTLAAFSFSDIQSASDALLVVDGMSVNRGSNLIGDVIQGVTMELLSQSSSASTVNVSRDTSAIKTTVEELVTAYNEAVSDFAILTGSINPDDPEDVFSGSLYGESSVRTIKNSLRSMLTSNSTTPGTTLKNLSDLGFSFDKNGILSINAKKLDSTLSSNFDDVVTIFGGNSLSTDTSKGVAGDAVKKIDTMLSSTGIIKRQTTSSESDQRRYNENLSRLEARMEVLLARYTRQFAIMDALVGQYNSQRTSLQSSFDAMMSIYTK